MRGGAVLWISLEILRDIQQHLACFECGMSCKWKQNINECLPIVLNWCVTHLCLCYRPWWCLITLKNECASRCHRRTFLSKWFHNIWRTFLFHKSFFVVKEGSSKEELYRTFDWLGLCGTKNGSSIALLEKHFEAPLFLSVKLCGSGSVF